MYQEAPNGWVLRLSDNTLIPNDDQSADRIEYEQWVQTGGITQPHPQEPTPSQRTLDENRYRKRAGIKDGLIAWMAADNTSRVRAGVWTVQDLMSLLDDQDLKKIQEMINSLSFELAMQALQAATNPLLTPEIKAAWVAKLQDNLYLVP